MGMVSDNNKYFMLFDSKVGGHEWDTFACNVAEYVERDPMLRSRLTAVFIRPMDMGSLCAAGARRVAGLWCREAKLALEDAGVMFDLWWHKNGNRYAFLVKQAQCMAGLWQERARLLERGWKTGVSSEN